MSSRFSKAEVGPSLEVFALNVAFAEDKNPNKVNLGVGAYRTEKGEPWVLPVVRKTEMAMAQDEALNHEYLPVLGLQPFCEAATKLLLGENSKPWIENRAFGIQTLSGTGALRVASEFLCKQIGYNIFYTSQPSWDNHKLVFTRAGLQDARQYRYWDPVKRDIDFDGLIEDLNNAPENSVIVLHVCAHNPTGCDPTKEQWMKIADVMEERKLFPLFDSAYQGFASGDPEADAWSVRYFAERGFELVCAQSFAKNFGLYNERIGNLTVVVNDKSVIAGIKSQIMWNIRAIYSNPPQHGARIVAIVLNNPSLFAEWKGCIEKMSSRIREMRSGLRQRLEALGTPGTWEHITRHIGLFSYTGLTSEQAEYLINHYHIYLLRSGRINICGLNYNNLDYVAQAFYDAIKKYPGSFSKL